MRNLTVYSRDTKMNAGELVEWLSGFPEDFPVRIGRYDGSEGWQVVFERDPTKIHVRTDIIPNNGKPHAGWTESPYLLLD